MAGFKKSGNFVHYTLTPLTDIHLHSNKTAELGPNGNIQYVYIFSVVAVLVLLIACVNFMNLSTARSSSRSKEVGVRKVLGSLRRNLIIQFLVVNEWNLHAKIITHAPFVSVLRISGHSPLLWPPLEEEGVFLGDFWAIFGEIYAFLLIFCGFLIVFHWFSLFFHQFSMISIQFLQDLTRKIKKKNKKVQKFHKKLGNIQEQSKKRVKKLVRKIAEEIAEEIENKNRMQKIACKKLYKKITQKIAHKKLLKKIFQNLSFQNFPFPKKRRFFFLCFY